MNQKINIDILNSKVFEILKNLEELNLIQINSLSKYNSDFTDDIETIPNPQNPFTDMEMNQRIIKSEENFKKGKFKSSQEILSKY